MVPSQSFYYHNKYPCVSSLVLQSCIDILMSVSIHYMRVLGKVFWKSPEIKAMLANCDCEKHKTEKEEHWQTHLSVRVEDMVELRYYVRTLHYHLKYGTGSVTRVTQFLKCDCVNNLCMSYGVENEIQLTMYTVLSKSELIIDVLEWINTPR